MRHTHLIQLYEKYNKFFIRETESALGWHMLPEEDDFWTDSANYRLYPKLPDECLEPNTDMIENHALYLGVGPIVLPEGVDRFWGWFLSNPNTSGLWVKNDITGLLGGYHYCIEANTAHSEEILQLNRSQK